MMQPVAGKRILVTFQTEPGEVLIREFEDIRHGGHAADAGHVGLLVLDETGADIRIKRDDAAFMLAPHQGFIGAAARLRDEADRAEMQRLAIGAQCRKLGFGDHPASGILVVKSVSRMAIHQLDEGDGRRARKGGAIAEIHLAGAQGFPQDIAHHVIGKTGEKGGGDAETPQRNRRVEDRSACIGGKTRLTQRRLPGQHVNQGFTTTQDHYGPPQNSKSNELKSI